MSQAVTTQAEYGSISSQRLADFLISAPASRAPILQQNFNSWKTAVPETELLQYFEPVQNQDSCQGLSTLISMLLLHPMAIHGTTEDGYHSRIDQCVGNFLHIFAPTFTLRRNSSQDSSSFPLKRPDYSATLFNKGCFFRGEEKKLESSEDPRLELYSKLQDVWPFPGLPYVLGYYSVGPIITFCKVSKGDAQGLHGLTLDLNEAGERLKCWNIVRNVARIIKFMANTTSTISPYDLQDIEKIHSMPSDWTRIIRFSGGHVMKQICLRDAETQARLDRVQRVLTVLGYGVEGVQPIISSNLSSSVKDYSKRRRIPPSLYIVTSFGAPIARVSSTAQLRDLVRFLLNTVERLNTRGITHRDIRLANIVMNGDGSYGLIDWDDSTVGLHNLPNADVAHFVTESHAPEMFANNNGTHNWTVDLWSIGYLIETSAEFATVELTNLMTRLMAAPSLRPTVSDARLMLGA
jgi:Protein kinase domain